MALKDVKRYYLSVQADYIKALKDLEELQKCCGEVSEEVVENVQNMTSKLVENYNRLSYIMFLFNKPADKKQAKKYEEENNRLLKYLKGNDEDTIKLEDANVLAYLNKLVKENKDGSGNAN